MENKVRWFPVPVFMVLPLALPALSAVPAQAVAQEEAWLLPDGDLALSLAAPYFGGRAAQEVGLEFRFGDMLSPALADIVFIPDTGSFCARLDYRHYWEDIDLRVPEEYRKQPSFWLGGGGGSWKIVFIIPFEEAVGTYGGGFSVPLGETALIEIECKDTIVENILSHGIRLEGTLAFLPTDDFYLRLGYIYNRYEPDGPGRPSNHSSIVASAGYLWGDAERGLSLGFSYRNRGNNGRDEEVNYFEVGFDWYMSARLGLGFAYEHVSGDLNQEGHAYDVSLKVRPTSEFAITGGWRMHHYDWTAEDYDSFFVQMSYAF